jgi:hypothetical protein
MGKCVIERPRRGSRTALSAKARDYGKIVEYDDGLEYEGLSRLPVSKKQEGYHKKLGDKDFTDVLGPLHNYLRNSCGRPWNDVYSEIARNLGRCGSWGVRHIISAHLDVARHTYRGVDGTVWVCDGHGVHKADGWYYDFYVEPETGILRQSLRRTWRSITRGREPAKPLDFVSIEDGMECRKFDGIWYFHEFVEVEVKTPVFLRGSFYRWNIDKQVVSKMKRQLGKKQLKQLELQNG